MVAFTNLAWGAFVWRNIVRKTYARAYLLYGQLVDDNAFQERLLNNPSTDEFARLREFLVNFGVHYAPIDLASRHNRVCGELKPLVQALKDEALETCDLTDNSTREAIGEAFRCLQAPRTWGGDVVASKVLHFFNPRLFVMLDSDIQTHYKAGYGGNGYVGFLDLMQEEVQEAVEEFRSLGLGDSPDQFLSQHLEYPFNRTLAKFIDDYNWITITKGWPDAVPEWLTNLLWPPSVLIVQKEI